MNDFLIAYKITGGNEGGWVFDDNDSGKETYCGISRKYFPTWEGWATVDSNKPLRTGQIIKDIKLEYMVEEFYRHNFWNAINGDNLPDQDTANQVYDASVNIGVQEALKIYSQS